MKTTRLLAVLVALAGPAWAYNEEPVGSLQWLDDWRRASNASTRLGGDRLVCLMQAAPSERKALDAAESALDMCEHVEKTEYAPLYVAGCAEIRAYIKKRWGY